MTSKTTDELREIIESLSEAHYQLTNNKKLNLEKLGLQITTINQCKKDLAKIIPEIRKEKMPLAKKNRW